MSRHAQDSTIQSTAQLTVQLTEPWTSGPVDQWTRYSFLKKLNVHAAPRRAVPPPYRPAPCEHLVFSNHTRVQTGPNTNKAKEDEEKQKVLIC